MMNVIQIPVDKIDPPELEMREVMTYEGLQELMDSIKENGLQQPLTVFARGVRFEVCAGARRFEACKRLGHTHVSCVVVDADPKKREELKIHENLKREDVDPVEEGSYYQTLVERRGFSVDDLVHATGRPASYVEGRILLTRLDPALKGAVSAKQISLAVARALDRFREPDVTRLFLQAAISGGANAETVNGWYESWKHDRESADAAARATVETGEVQRVPPPPVFCHCCWQDVAGKSVYWIPVDATCYNVILRNRAQPPEGAQAAEPPGGPV